MKTVTLGDVVVVRSSLVDPTKDCYADLPHIAPDTIERDTGRLLSNVTVREAGVQSGKYRFEAGDVLYSKIRPNLNKVAIVDFGGLCSADMYALQVDSTQITAAFLQHLLRGEAFVRYATNLSSRANIPKLNRAQLLKFPFGIPPLDEQLRITAILDLAEGQRAKRRESLGLLALLRQSIFAQLFGSVDQLAPLGSLVSGMRNGISPSSGGEVRATVLTLSAVTGGRFDPGCVKEATFYQSPTKDQRVSKDDFLICRGNGNRSLVGVGVHPRANRPDLVFPDTVIAARLDPKRVDPVFLEAAWSQESTRRKIEAVARTTNGTFKVNQQTIGGVEVPLPPLDKQRRYRELVAAIPSPTAHELDELFAALQARSFSGQL
ncbi:restriction endonuclease subunit S [Mycolicibacterium sp. GCM10028919]|uniref:restriction endonuclease subunit S n=1 Tax=Mycolicibacterium sp. GCM10028919 TaxID=3273401 RepID=UPI00361FD63C